MLDNQNITTQYCIVFHAKRQAKGWAYVVFSSLPWRVLLRRFSPKSKNPEKNVLRSQVLAFICVNAKIVYTHGTRNPLCYGS